MRKGQKITLISTGSTLAMTMEAADELAKQGNMLSVISMPCLWPIDYQVIIDAARKGDRIITIEEHGIGGLGSMVAEVLANTNIAAEFMPLHLNREPLSITGTQSYLLEQHGLTIKRIIEAVLHPTLKLN